MYKRSFDLRSLPGTKICPCKAPRSATFCWRISPNSPRKLVGAIRFSDEKARSRETYTAAKFTPMLNVSKPQQLSFLRISTVNELYTADVECAVFSMRMNIREAHLYGRRIRLRLPNSYPNGHGMRKGIATSGIGVLLPTRPD